jgi:glycine oxidase
MARMDCIVIGGGIAGILTARELAAAGLAVALLERNGLGSGATGAAGGILSSLYPWREPPALQTLSAWSQSRYPSLINALSEETGIDVEWEKSGLLILENADANEALDWAARSGVRLSLVSAREIRELEPGLEVEKNGIRAGLWLPDVAQVRMPRLTRALRQALLSVGVDVREGVEVISVAVEDGRVTGVDTARGRIAAPRVIVCAGAWSSGLLGPLAPAGFAVRPVRGQMIAYQGPPALLRHIVLHDEHYLVPRRDGLIVVGSTVEESGFDNSTTSAARHALEQAARVLLPAVCAYPCRHHWSGLRPASSDQLPYIGKHPDIEGLFFNTGHFRSGILHALASARLLREILLGQSPSLEPAAYDPARTGHPWDNG